MIPNEGSVLVKIEQVVEDHDDVQVRKSLDEQTIKRYMEDFDSLPPVAITVVEHGDGVKYVLTDGFTRIEAARRKEHTVIAAVLTEGTMAEAKRDAALANMRHGKPLTAAERDRAIIQIKRSTKWGDREIAKVCGCSYQTVNNALKVLRVERIIGDELSKPLIPATMRAVAEAKTPEDKKLVADAAGKHQWTANKTAKVAKEVSEAGTPEAKAEIIAEASAAPVEKPSPAKVEVFKTDDVVKAIFDNIDRLRGLDVVFLAAWAGEEKGSFAAKLEECGQFLKDLSDSVAAERLADDEEPEPEDEDLDTGD